MSTWNTTSTNSRFGSTVVGPAIEGSSSTAWRSKQSLSIPFRTSPWSNVPREQRVRPQPVGAKTGNLSEVNNHLLRLQLELERVKTVIAQLEQLQNANAGSGEHHHKSKRGRKSMGSEERESVSLRMKRYWKSRGEPRDQIGAAP